MPVSTTAGRAYATIIAPLKGPYSHCFVLPWLKRGGADIGTLHHIRAVSEIPKARVWVIITEDAESPRLGRLPASVSVVLLGKSTSKLSFHEKLTVLVRLLVQLGPAVIHNINSQLMWEAIKRHGTALCQQSRMFVSLFCDEYTVNDIPVGYARTYLPACYHHLAGVLSDNASFPGLLIRRYGYSRNIFATVYFPTSCPNG
ncbi:MAG: hypothetical protein P4M05_36170 [Bradyrhizobium sp.]|nr:hypothetical protein [Bradyrhizobium sp.]